MIGSIDTRPIASSRLGERIGGWSRAQATPVRLFVWLSLAFGLPLIALTPPLRGADEPSHFLRAYGIAGGEVIATERIDGRLGLRLPAELHADFSLFEDARYRFAENDTRYGEAFAEYRRRLSVVTAEAGRAAFVPYQGAEAYSPVAYIPYAAVALFGRAVGADFLSMLYAMRVVGLFVSTAIVAAAIALAPGLHWPFLLIALLPSALYGRATVSADGTAIALALLTAALALRAGALGEPRYRLRQRLGWMTLCILVKPSQLALAPIELLATRWPQGSWRLPMMVVLPGALLTCLWVYLSGAEIAAWRLTDTGLAPEQFAIGWKLEFMLRHPAHFLELLFSSVWQQAAVLHQQLIGVLGWLDTPLRDWAYPLLGLALVVAMTDRLEWPDGARTSALFVAGLTALGYVVFVYFLLYVTWTPVEANQIWGMQGRYLLPALPAVAIGIAAALPTRRSARPAVIAATAGAVLSGLAAIDAVWRVNW